MVAVDGAGAQGPVSTLTITFDRSCLVLPNPPILTLSNQDDVDRLAVCASLGSTRVDIIGTDIETLQPMEDITVSAY